MSLFDICFVLVFAAFVFVAYVAVSDRIRLRDAKRFVAAILSNQRSFIGLIQGGELTDRDLAEIMIRDAAQKLNRPLHRRLRRAMNEDENHELVFEIAVVSKVLTDKRDLYAPKITISDDMVMLHDLFLISGTELQKAA